MHGNLYSYSTSLILGDKSGTLISDGGLEGDLGGETSDECSTEMLV